MITLLYLIKLTFSLFSYIIILHINYVLALHNGSSRGRHNATSMRNLFDPTRLAFEGDSPLNKNTASNGVEPDVMSPATKKASERWTWLTTFQRNLTCK